MDEPHEIGRALDAELAAEREFVADARQTEHAPKGWPAALLMFHVSMWRERLRNALNDISEGRPYAPPPDNADEFNDGELANGIGTPLADAAARSETLHQEIASLYEALGERPFTWYSAKTTTEAVLRVSYMHPRIHLYEYVNENGDTPRALRLLEDAAVDMRGANAPPLILGAAIYNMALVRVAQGKPQEAVKLLEEAIALRSDLKAAAAADDDLASLHEDAGFQELIG